MSHKTIRRIRIIVVVLAMIMVLSSCDLFMLPIIGMLTYSDILCRAP